MGTLSKRRLEDFGADIRDRVERFRTNVGSKLDDIADDAEMKGHEEGRLTTRLERLTAALPSTTWLALAGGSIATSIALRLAGRNHASLVAGLFAPTMLLIGAYNKLVKVAASDRSASAV